jgi:hypothetical protein
MNIIKKAISTCRRNIVGKQKGGVITRMVKTTGKSCDISIDASVPTACWSFESDKHIIKIGTQLDTICNADTKSNDAKMKKFIEVVIRHETEHGLLTCRDDAVAKELRSESLPFRLWNLFEDVRIEYASATRKRGDGAFRWTNYQDVDAAYSSASALLWAIKTNEAGIKKQASAYVPRWTGTEKILEAGKERFTRLLILKFYRRACQALTSQCLIPIVKEWVAIFGEEIDPKYADAMVNGSTDEKSKEKSQPTIAPTGLDKMKADSEHLEKYEWFKNEQIINKHQITRIARCMKNIVQSARTTRNRLSCNGTRLHANAAMCGSDRAFINRKRSNGKRSVTMIVDMSGSMRDPWAINGGREFVLAFRELARKQLIDLNLILSCSFSHKCKSYVVKKDDTDKWVNDLYPSGNGEGIMGCMKTHLAKIKASTTTVVFTDSYLRDNDIDTQAYRNMGINAIATYIEPYPSLLNSGRKRMDKHFGRSVIACDANELAQRLMREILKD